MPIYEPGLAELVQRNVRDGRLKFTTDLVKGVTAAQLIFIAVGTPQSADGSADLSTVWAVADAIADTITGPKIVVIKSTVPVGTNRAVTERIAAQLPARDRRGQQSGVPEGRSGHRRLHEARPRGGRRPPARGRSRAS